MHKKPDRIDTLFYGRILNIRSEYFPDVVDIDNQIPPLRYLLRKDDFDSLNAPGTRDERTKRLDRIWSTTLNPTLRQDFYARVRQANEYFTTFVDGWQTPMGMVYIVAGPPSDVDCQGGLNESWYYDYHQGYAVFIFQTNAAPSDRGNERSYYSLLRYPTQDVWEAFMSRWRQ
jgi:GWxTD domain-containing protein